MPTAWKCPQKHQRVNAAEGEEQRPVCYLCPTRQAASRCRHISLHRCPALSSRDRRLPQARAMALEYLRKHGEQSAAMLLLANGLSTTELIALRQEGALFAAVGTSEASTSSWQFGCASGTEAACAVLAKRESASKELSCEATYATRNETPTGAVVSRSRSASPNRFSCSSVSTSRTSALSGPPGHISDL